MRPLTIRADRVDLDADDVAGLEEGLPGLDRVVGPGEVAHAAVHHLADGGAVDPVMVIDYLRMMDLDHATAVRPGHAIRKCRTRGGSDRRIGDPGRVAEGLAGEVGEGDTADEQTGGQPADEPATGQRPALVGVEHDAKPRRGVMFILAGRGAGVNEPAGYAGGFR